MRNLPLLVASAIFFVGPAISAEGLQLRYSDPSGRMSFNIEQEITVNEGTPVASRSLAFELEFRGGEGDETTVTVETARASYEAHGMEQRLSTRQTVGDRFSLAILEEGRRLGPDGDTEEGRLNLDAGVAGVLSLAETLSDTLPVLPALEVEVGDSWTTERTIRSLEGWGFGSGTLKSRHRVTSVDATATRTLVAVESSEQARLAPLDERPGFVGKVSRTLRWMFDATDGRLLTLSIEQESDGVSPLPQGEVACRQRSVIELAPVS